MSHAAEEITTDPQDAQREHHRRLLLEGAERLRLRGPFDVETVDVAVQRLTERMDTAEWIGDRYRRKSRPYPRDLGDATELECDTAELVVVRLLARTQPENQFSVTPYGDVFAGALNGYHYEFDRFYVSGLSPVLDAAADILLGRTGRQGGRMFVHTSKRVIERASDRSVLAYLVEPGGSDRASDD